MLLRAKNHCIQVDTFIQTARKDYRRIEFDNVEDSELTEREARKTAMYASKLGDINVEKGTSKTLF